MTIKSRKQNTIEQANYIVELCENSVESVEHPMVTIGRIQYIAKQIVFIQEGDFNR